MERQKGKRRVEQGGKGKGRGRFGTGRGRQKKGGRNGKGERELRKDEKWRGKLEQGRRMAKAGPVWPTYSLVHLLTYTVGSDV